VTSENRRYIAYDPRKSFEVWRALRAGFQARDAHIGAALETGTTAIVGGLDGGSDRLLRRCRETGHPYVFVDSGYFATRDAAGRRRRYRVVPDAYAHHWELPPYFAETFGRPRFEELGLTIEPWRKSGRDVIVCLSSDAHTRFFGLQSWLDDTLEQLRRGTDRPIVIRRKGDPVPLEQQLKTAWAVVTWSSNVAVTAALAGIPVFVGPECAALPVGASILAGGGRFIEEPVYPDREAWAWGLAAGQFTADEIAAGRALNSVDAFRAARSDRKAA
jgi:hypothetical protein